MNATPDEWRIDTDAFRTWCDRQADQSRSMTSRVIVDDDDQIRFRLREGDRDGGPEDVVLLKGREADTIRFEYDGDVRAFHLHRRDVTLAPKTLIVKTDDGHEICRAGTGTRNRRGPFPI